MGNITIFETPRPAKINDVLYPRYSATLANMGLKGQTFQAVGVVDKSNQVIVHPDDLVAPAKDPFCLNGKLVVFEQ